MCKSDAVKKSRGDPPLPHFLLYLCRLIFFRSETSRLSFFKPCARFKTIFIKIEPRVMTRRCVIAHWVQRKTDFPLKLHTNRVFCLLSLSGYTSTIMFYLIYLVWSKNMCKRTLPHIIAEKCNFCLKK